MLTVPMECQAALIVFLEQTHVLNVSKEEVTTRQGKLVKYLLVQQTAESMGKLYVHHAKQVTP